MYYTWFHLNGNRVCVISTFFLINLLPSRHTSKLSIQTSGLKRRRFSPLVTRSLGRWCFWEDMHVGKETDTLNIVFQIGEHMHVDRDTIWFTDMNMVDQTYLVCFLFLYIYIYIYNKGICLCNVLTSCWREDKSNESLSNEYIDLIDSTAEPVFPRFLYHLIMYVLPRNPDNTLWET